MNPLSGRWPPYAALAVLCAAVLVLRPPLPVDETRYLSVAWEMWLQKSFFVLTLNFEPYHHKPPLLFWLVNGAWSIFGVGRAAAMLVVFLLAALALRLTEALAEALFPGRPEIARVAPWLLLGNAAFLFFCTYVEFDVLLTCCVLASFLALHAFARGRGLRFAALAGLFVGLGVLAKGPVVLVHAVWPFLLYPLWRDPEVHLAPRTFFRAVPLVVLCALAAVAAWLGPVMLGTGADFIHDLVWRQSAGRITGSMEVSHARPLFWYLPMVPVAFLPWIALPQFWRAGPVARLWDWVRSRGADPAPERRVLRFLTLWFWGVLIVFSLISGKQAKYLLPAVPLAAVFLAYFLAALPERLLRGTALAALGVFLISQAVSALLVFPKRDLRPVAAYVAARPDKDWGVLVRYEGELNFLSRARKPFTVLPAAQAAAWLGGGANRALVDMKDDMEGLGEPVFTQAYRRREARVFTAR